MKWSSFFNFKFLLFHPHGNVECLYGVGEGAEGDDVYACFGDFGEGFEGVSFAIPYP